MDETSYFTLYSTHSTPTPMLPETPPFKIIFPDIKQNTTGIIWLKILSCRLCGRKTNMLASIIYYMNISVFENFCRWRDIESSVPCFAHTSGQILFCQKPNRRPSRNTFTAFSCCLFNEGCVASEVGPAMQISNSCVAPVV